MRGSVARRVALRDSRSGTFARRPRAFTLRHSAAFLAHGRAAAGGRVADHDPGSASRLPRVPPTPARVRSSRRRCSCRTLGVARPALPRAAREWNAHETRVVSAFRSELARTLSVRRRGVAPRARLLRHVRHLVCATARGGRRDGARAGHPRRRALAIHGAAQATARARQSACLRLRALGARARHPRHRIRARRAGAGAPGGARARMAAEPAPAARRHPRLHARSARRCPLAASVRSRRDRRHAGRM